MAFAAANDGLTDQQRIAVDKRGSSVVLTSGAGCGKTTVLTRRYLSHLDRDGASVGQVVAITFTAKAAREMRDRIRKAVLQRLDNATSDDAIKTWEKHLRDLETAQISTIHAFCTALLRQHAREAGLDPQFEVLEDYLASNLREQAVAAALQKLLTSEMQAGKDLHRLVPLFGWVPVVRGVESLLAGSEHAQREAWVKRRPEEVGASWRAFATNTLLPRYLPFLMAADPAIAHFLWLSENIECIGQKMQANIDLVHVKLRDLPTCANLAAAVGEIKEAAKVGSEKGKAWRSEEDYERVKAAMAKFREALPKRLALFTQEAEGVEEAAEIGQCFLRVAAEAAREYERLKRDRNVLDFDDLLVRARRLLRDDASVRDRVRERFWFVLIDELQDTDDVQTDFVEQLTGDGLVHGKLFAVGDHSQSIYRFRGADVAQFGALGAKMRDDGRLNLDINFRSQPAVLHFVNALVGEPKVGKSIQRVAGLEDYSALKGRRSQLADGPCVEFLWTPKPVGADPADDADGGGDQAAEGASANRMAEAETLARRIAAMIRNGERLVAERSPGSTESLRPVRLADVVLLFQKMTNVELYESALREEGLDYYLVGGRAYFAQQEIYDLLNLLRALENPQDSLSLAGALRSPFFCLSDEALFWLCRNKGGLWTGLRDPQALAHLPPFERGHAERALFNLDAWRALKDRLPIAVLLHRIFRDSGFDAAMQFEPLGDRKLANLWKLIDLARTFDRSGFLGLADFIERLGDLVRSQPREEQAATQPEKADVVRLMTIHQAKGLEFPVVFVVDIDAKAGWQRSPVAQWDANLGCVVRPPEEDPPLFTNYASELRKASEAEAEWREGTRKFYVACTRAEDYLVLSASLDANFQPTSAWMRLVAERFDLRTGRCLVVGVPQAEMPKVRVTDISALPQIPPGKGVPETPPLPPEPALRSKVPGTDDCWRLADLEVVLFGDEIAARANDSEDESDLSKWPNDRDGLARRRRVLSTPDTWRSVAYQCQLGGLKVCGAFDLLHQDDGWHIAVAGSLPPMGSAWKDQWTAGPVRGIFAAISLEAQVGSLPSQVIVMDPVSGRHEQMLGERLPLAEFEKWLLKKMNETR
jgi:ATP-dependent helicase/nuclease subunit A